MLPVNAVECICLSWLKLCAKSSKLNVHTLIINAMELRNSHKLSLLIPGLRQQPHFKTTDTFSSIFKDFWHSYICKHTFLFDRVTYWWNYFLRLLLLSTMLYLTFAWLVTSENWNKCFTNALYLFWQRQAAAAEQDCHYISQSCFWIIWQYEQKLRVPSSHSPPLLHDFVM